MTQCGLVFPVWQHIGWVLWVGTPTKEKLFNIKYVRCTEPAVDPVMLNGYAFHWCTEHKASESGGSWGGPPRPSAS